MFDITLFAFIVAQASAGDALDAVTNYLIQLGVAGIILLLLFVGILWTRPAVDAIKADLKETKAQRDKLLDLVQPLLERITFEMIPLMQEYITSREAKEEQIRDLQAENHSLRRENELLRQVRGQ